MLGHRMVAALAETHDVHATARDVRLADETRLRAIVHEFDVADGAAGRVLDDVAPELVVNCVGIVKQLDEAKHPVPSIRVNALFPHELAEACARTSARLVHISTDCVFSGELPYPGAYAESDLADARDLYGRSKLLGEVGAPALTLRTSIIGPELHRGTGLYEWFRRQGDDAVVQGFRQAWFSGLTTDAFARVVVAVAQESPELSGLYHVSADPISKHDLLLGLRDALGASCEIVGVDEPHVNRVLDSSRFRQRTGISIPSWEEMLGHYRKESHVETA
jgi:dTDP-4-dehydrorhamnose reductase